MEKNSSVWINKEKAHTINRLYAGEGRAKYDLIKEMANPLHLF